MLKIDPQSLHVLTPDVGGGFGTKGFNYREYPLVVKAVETLGRPVKWVSDRSEHFLADAHGRDHVTTGRLALDANGRVLALRHRDRRQHGLLLQPVRRDHSLVRHRHDDRALRHPDAFTRVCKGVFTHTVPTDAYRGAGRPEAAFLIERLMDEAARVTGPPPAEIRRRNFIRPEQMPYKTVTGNVYDSGEFAATHGPLARPRRRGRLREAAGRKQARGRIRGLGFSTYVEICAFKGSEPAKAVLEADGTVSLHIGTQSTGQGHRTAYAQFVAGPLGLDYERIRVVQGDSDALPKGGGTGGSRSIPLGAPSVDRASRLLADQIKAARRRRARGRRRATSS